MACGSTLARRHGRVTARLASVDLDPDGPPGSGGGFATHALRGYAAQSVSEREGWPLLAAVGRAARLDEMLFRVALNYKRFDAAPGEREIDTRSPAREKDVPFVARRVFEARAADEERAEASAASAGAEDEADDAGETRAFRFSSASATATAVESARAPQPRNETAIPPAPERNVNVSVSFSQPRHHERAPPAVRGFGALPPAPPGNVASPADVFLSPRFPTPPARRSPVARGAAFGAFAKR